ncbi:hypothetical protein Pyn_05696 [Prunus yedoensis var. nudiflora]|uniref:Uncharacterized protein n=1 Tax=Prunus yedoensis var. nudiflora TaxID=2094558 RepID=A0A314XK88_PRUYE|nr:hypothetical protein Pyn_05696 [Prunus yedoensis var. nudiflora]
MLIHPYSHHQAPYPDLQVARNFWVIGRCDGQSGGVNVRAIGRSLSTSKTPIGWVIVNLENQGTSSRTHMPNLPYLSDDAQISSSDLLARALVLVGARRRGLRENEVVGGGWWVRNEGGDVGREGGGRRRMGGGDAGFGFRV